MKFRMMSTPNKSGHPLIFRNILGSRTKIDIHCLDQTVQTDADILKIMITPKH